MESKNQNHRNQQGLSRISAKIRRLRLRPLLEAKLLEILFRLKSLPKWGRRFVVISAGTRLISFAGSWSYFINKQWAMKIVDPFLFSSQPMPRCWLIKYATDDIAWIMMCWSICILAALVSDLIFLVALIWLGWHIIDAIMFWVNYKHSPMIYLDITWTSLIFMWTAIKGYSKETISRIKSIF